METTPGFNQGGFPSGSTTTQIQNKTLTARQPVKQQSFSRNINPPKGSVTPSALTAYSQRPAAQSQSSQWKIKSAGVKGGTWVEDTFGTLGSVQNSVQQQVITSTNQINAILAKRFKININVHVNNIK